MKDKTTTKPTAKRPTFSASQRRIIDRLIRNRTLTLIQHVQYASETASRNPHADGICPDLLNEVRDRIKQRKTPQGATIDISESTIQKLETAFKIIEDANAEQHKIWSKWKPPTPPITNAQLARFRTMMYAAEESALLQLHFANFDTIADIEAMLPSTVTASGILQTLGVKVAQTKQPELKSLASAVASDYASAY